LLSHTVDRRGNSMEAMHDRGSIVAFHGHACTWVLTNYLSYYIYYCCSRVPRTLPLPYSTTITLLEKWRWAKSAPKGDKHDYSNKLIYEGTGKLQRSQLREWKEGWARGKTLIHRDEIDRGEKMLGTTSRDCCSSTTTYITHKGWGITPNQPTEGWGGREAFRVTKEGIRVLGFIR
jgi:hypothetical protein